MANPNGFITVPPLPNTRIGGATQYTDTVLTDTLGTWNTYIMGDAPYQGTGIAIQAPSTAVVKVQASCDSVATIMGDTTADLATEIAAGTFTGWTQSASGSQVTFTAATTGVRAGTYGFQTDTGALGFLNLTTPGVAGVAAVFTLTVTAGATANGNVGVAINGGSTVNTAVLLGDTLAAVATKIAASSFTGYVVTNPAAGAVVFTATATGPQVGANTVTPNATGVTATVAATTPGVTAVAAVATLNLQGPATQQGSADITLNSVATNVLLTKAGTAALWVDVPSATSTGGTAYIGGVTFAVTAFRTVIATALASNKATFTVRTNGQKY